MMRWFRKYSKKIMVGVVVFIMVIFLLPSGFKSNRGPSSPNYEIATLDVNGKSVKIRQADINEAHRQLQYLHYLKFDSMYIPLQNGSVMPVIVQLRQACGELEPVSVMTANALLFGEAGINRQLRDLILRETLQVAPDRETLDKLAAQIDAITDNPRGNNMLYFLLLAREAQALGITATNDQINAALDLRGQLISIGRLDNIPIASILKMQGGTEAEMRRAIGNYLSILRTAGLISRSLNISEPELRKAVRDMTQMENITGDFVAFEADLFLKKVAEPTEEKIQQQFAAFKDRPLDSFGEDNPFGFGYQLPDRVQVAYIGVDLQALQTTLRDQFNALPLVEQEEKIRAFWTAHPDKFRRQKPADPQQPDSRPLWEVAPYDTVASQARDMWLQDQAIQAAQLRLVPLLESPADYQAFAAASAGNSIPVITEQTPYLDQKEMAEYQDFGSTYKMNGERAEQHLISMLFQCQALTAHKTAGRFDVPPMETNQTYGPFLAFDNAQKPSFMYFLKIIGADAARTAASLDDDGSAGPAEQAVANAAGKLREKVAADLRAQSAFAMAKEYAQRFRDEAQTDWDAALKTMNQSLKEADQTMDPLIMETLATLRDQNRQAQRLLSQNMSYSMQEYLARNAVLLRKAMELFQNDPAAAAHATMIEDPQYGRCLVLRDLYAALPDQQEYLTTRPLVAENLLNRQRMLSTFDYFLPDNITTRMKLTYRDPAQQNALQPVPQLPSDADAPYPQ